MNSLYPRAAEEPHTWTFFRTGGVDQVQITKGADVENLSSLNPTLWIALACPTKGLELDAHTLEIIDSDHDGRIRPPEILAAIAWCKEAFVNFDIFFEEGDAVPLKSIRSDTALGKDLLAGAKRILSNSGKADDAEISLASVTAIEATFAATRLNGDGIVPVFAAETEEAKALIGDVIATCGSVVDRSGQPGIDQPRVEKFFDEVAKLHAWLLLGDVPAVKVLGEATDEAFAAFIAVRAKVDDFFTRCRLLAYDPRLQASVQPADLVTVGDRARSLSTADAEVLLLPLAQPVAGGVLSFDSTINPAWSSAFETFRKAALVPILGATSTLSEADWNRVVLRFAEYAAWQKSKPETVIESLGFARVRALAAGDGRAELSKMVLEDLALAAEFGQVENVEKMIRLRSHLVRLLRNFVNFAEFYGTRKAIFQTGRLFVDGRSCDFCVSVEDVGKHAALAGLAQSYLVYAECRRNKDGDTAAKGAPVVIETRTIVAIVSGGVVDNLMVGRNGVFYDRSGRTWDAAIIKVIENPINVGQAFLAPYKRFIRLIQEQVAKRAAAANDESNKGMESHAAAVATVDKAALPVAAGAAAPPEKKIDIGTVAALGVAVGAIGAFASSIAAMFLGLGVYMPLGFVVVLLGISGPSMLIAWLKLRQRNIGPILDASGWAVNAFARINLSFGGALTSVASLPKGSVRILHDPYADKGKPWGLYITVGVLLALATIWYVGKADRFLPEPAKAATILHRAPPPEPVK